MAVAADAKAMKPNASLVTSFARMWPREVFHWLDKVARSQILAGLNRPGVYVLYRDDVPYYVGKADGRLRHRLWQHANRVASRHYHFWNFFSAFVIEDARERSFVEAILIAAMPTANSARPKLEREVIPVEVRDILRQMREPSQVRR